MEGSVMSGSSHPLFTASYEQMKLLYDVVNRPEQLVLRELVVDCPFCGGGKLQVARLPDFGTVWYVCTTDHCVYLHGNTGGGCDTKH
jgi:hypothetical protein